MSRTKKDRPFWVKINQDAKYTNHDHHELGKTYFRAHHVLDENGKPVEEEQVQYVRADTVSDMYRWEFYGLTDAELEQVRRRVRMLLSANRGGEPVAVGSRVVYKLYYTEHQVPDHCTEGTLIPGRKGWYRTMRDLPCTPDLGHEGYFWRYGDSGSRQSFLRKWHGHDRTRTRSTLRNMTKAANSWEDGWEDDFEEVETLTEPYKNGMAWALWL